MCVGARKSRTARSYHGFNTGTFIGSTMLTSSVHDPAPSGRADAGDEWAIEQVLTAPECDALMLYGRLTSAQQWQARTRATGERRAALVQYHALNVAQLR